MLQKETLRFLDQLKQHNNKPWFEEHRQQYEAVKKDFEQFTATILKAVAEFDTSVAHLGVKDCLFRINRDVRFSKDKTPYKTNFGMGISKDGKKGIAAGYYLHCEPGAAFVGGGLWMPAPPELKKVRQEIDYNWQELSQLLQKDPFAKIYGDLSRTDEYTLSRPPKGYEEDNAAITYLKLKSFVAMHPLSDKELISNSLEKTVIQAFEALKPVLDFINRALD
jgi:uncharacterized protein (TIGR02453 family)